VSRIRDGDGIRDLGRARSRPGNASRHAQGAARSRLGGLIQPTSVASGGRITQWFQYVPGANWREPTGPGSSISGKDNHPVVHSAYEDALAYARWRGRELPTEAQWEFAARGGRDGEDDWSSAFDAEGKPIANSWQGIFPVYNTNEDGYAGTAPVGCFKPN